MLRVGSKWSRIEIVGEGTREGRIEFDGGGHEAWDVQVWQLRCECGKEFDADKRGFAKKEHKDCGCGAASEDGFTVGCTFTIPIRLKKDIEAYALKHTQGNVSHAAALLMRAGLRTDDSEANWKEIQIKTR